MWEDGIYVGFDWKGAWKNLLVFQYLMTFYILIVYLTVKKRALDIAKLVQMKYTSIATKTTGDKFKTPYY